MAGGEGTVLRGICDLGEMQRRAGTLPASYYAGLARGYCAGCGEVLPVGVAGHCGAACVKRERDRNQKLFGKRPLPDERRRSLETEATCSYMPPDGRGRA
jgi:hypothetical protein